MNYLAHARLSFGDPEILVGNMISDFVKGKKKFDYPHRIQQGIHLHRCIDQYTDEHIASRKAMAFFRPAYRLYSGAIVDVAYDHFLASDETEFSESSLYTFSQEVYGVLRNNAKWLPERFARMFPYMQSQNWLFHYRHRQGARNSFEGLVRRAAYLSVSIEAFRIFGQHYQPLQLYYRQFWAEVKEYAHAQFNMLPN